jgi:hypothetical protein
VERVVDGNGADAVLIGEFNGGIHRAIRGGLPQFLVGIPDFCCGETRRFLFDLRTRHAALRSRAEEMIEVQRLDRVVRADSVA